MVMRGTFNNVESNVKYEADIPDYNLSIDYASMR